MKIISKIILTLFILNLCSCASIARHIQNSINVSQNSYPAATASNPELQKSPIIRLSEYKSPQLRFKQKRSIAIALAASGGGYRAANLTLGILLGLEKLRSPALEGNMLQQVDYFSTVSGGGFAVGYYLTRLKTYFMNNHHVRDYSLAKDVNYMLTSDNCYFNPLRADLTPLIFFGENRGVQLEEKLNATLLNTGCGGLKLGDIFVPKNSNQKVFLPFWAMNSTIYQNADIFPFTPDIIKKYEIIGYNHHGRHYFIPGNFNDSTYGYDIPVSVGLAASMAVPFAFPATTLTSQGCKSGYCYLQLLDGGLGDNLGVYTALNLLQQDKSKIKILLIADAYRDVVEPYSRIEEPPKGMPLILRVLTVGTDANRSRIKSSIHYMARDLLCGKNSKNVIIVYLDLSKYPRAKQIGTQLTMSRSDQRYLISVGKELVENNSTLKILLDQLNENHLNLGKC